MSIFSKCFGRKETPRDFEDSHWDFEELISLSCELIVDIYTKALNKNPDHQFYSCVLTTYDGVEGLGFHMNSKENYEACLRGAGTYENLERAERHKEFEYYKWFWGEWGDFEFIGDQTGFSKTDQWLREHLRTVGDNQFTAFRSQVFDAMIAILKRLDNQGLFGTSADRENMFVYAGVYDSDELVLRSARALNSESNWHKNGAEVARGLAIGD